MKKHLSFLLLISFYFNNLQAQQLDYRDYKFPEVEYKALWLNADLSGRKNTASIGNDHFFNTDIDFRGLKYVNKDVSQRISFGQVSANFYTDKDKMFISSGISLKDFYRKYMYDKLFWEIGYNGDIGQYYSKPEKIGSYGGSLNPTVKVGKGRIDVTNKVALAQYLLDDLKNSGILTEEPSPENIFALASMMDRYDFTRILDSRVYRVEFITAVSDWLSKNVAVEPGNEIRLTTIVTDNLFYANTGFRSSGRRWSIGIDPQISFAKADKINLSDSYYGSDLSYDYIIHRPVGRFIQDRINFHVGFGYFGAKNNRSISTIDTKLWRPTASVEFSRMYNPNSRTVVDIRGQLWSTYRAQKQELVNYKERVDEKLFRLVPSLSVNGTYFLNYHTQLYFNAGIAYNYEKTRGSSYFYNQSSLGLSPASYVRPDDLIMTRNNNPFPAAFDIARFRKFSASISMGITYNIF